jgi:FtsH-binding integral membrane protein
LQAYQDPEAIAEMQRGFITRVYGWMTAGLLVTAGAAMFTILNKSLLAAIVTNAWIFMGLFAAELVLVIALTAGINRLHPSLAGLAFFGYAALNGVTLSILVLVYTSASIFETFFIAACAFGVMTVFGYTTRRDLTAFGSLLIMGLIGVLLASLVNLFLQNSAVYWIITYAGILVFIGLIAYDTQRLKNMAVGLGEEGDLVNKASIIGALRLYLDFINLFLMLLRIFGRRR